MSCNRLRHELLPGLSRLQSGRLILRLIRRERAGIVMGRIVEPQSLLLVLAEGDRLFENFREEVHSLVVGQDSRVGAEIDKAEVVKAPIGDTVHSANPCIGERDSGNRVGRNILDVINPGIGRETPKL